MSVGGWTVAETAQVRTGGGGGGGGGRPKSAQSVLQSPPARPGGNSSSLKRNHVRWRDDNDLEERSCSQDVDLDKLLDGLEQLTEALPDLRQDQGERQLETSGGVLHSRSGKEEEEETAAVAAAAAAASVAKVNKDRLNNLDGGVLKIHEQQNCRARSPLNRQDCIDEDKPNNVADVATTKVLLQSRDTYEHVDSPSFSRPYHTLRDSKPFSYIHSSRDMSRSSSREALTNFQAGLESPGLLRKILGKGDEGKENSINGLSPRHTNGHMTPLHSSTPEFSRDASKPSQYISHLTIHTSDEEASLTWLERQQLKLRQRRENDNCARKGVQKQLVDEFKSYLSPSNARSETTTDGYASSDVGNVTNIYSEASTRESSPGTKQQHHQQHIYNIPVKIEQSYSSNNDRDNWQQPASNASTLRASNNQDHYGTRTSYGYSSLSRQRSDTSFDRSRPFINTRQRYNSGSESEAAFNYSSDLFGRGAGQLHRGGSNTSLDSASQFNHYWGGATTGWRPTTPAFPPPSAPPTPVFGRPSPAASIYNQPLGGGGNSRLSSRRGSVSSEPADLGPGAAEEVRLVKDSRRFWYRPLISREEAITALRDRAPGAFIVRDSNSFPGAFGLALRVATPPPHIAAGSSSGRGGADPAAELVRHFLIEPTSKGVRLKGYANEPVFASLSALVYQHTVTQLALPTRLVLPQTDYFFGCASNNGESAAAAQLRQLLALGAACNVTYLLTLDTDSLTGPAAVRKSVSRLFATVAATASLQPPPLLVHFKVSGDGITLTDGSRRRFFRRHFSASSVSYCGIDPEDRRWFDMGKVSRRVFAFVARKPTARMQNQCHVFAEHDPEQPARAIVNFVNKIMLVGAAGAKV